MKKFLISVFILVDILVIAVASLFLFANVKGSPSPLLKNIPGLPNPVSAVPVAPVSSPNVSVATSTDSAKPMVSGIPSASSIAGSTNSRKILFSYRNSKAKKVMVRADFTGWRAEPMEKDAATSTWKYMAVLEPGEYAYCYSVDDKSIRDPANKHTKTVGKTVVSAIVVQPPVTGTH